MEFDATPPSPIDDDTSRHQRGSYFGPLGAPRYSSVTGAPSPELTHATNGGASAAPRFTTPPPHTQTAFPSFGTEASGLSFASTEVATDGSGAGASFGSSRGIGGEPVNVSPVSGRDNHTRDRCSSTIATTATNFGVSSPSLSRVPVGSKRQSPSETQGPYWQSLYPPLSGATPTEFLAQTPYDGRGFSTSTAYDPTPYQTGSIEDALSSRYSRQQGPVDAASTEGLARNIGTESLHSGKTRRSKFDNEFQPDTCPTRSNFFQGPKNWLNISILLLAIFSTIFSGIFMVIAIRAPLWGRGIQTTGRLSASTANVLTQLFAKLIELSFVTVFVAFLGQVLSRRAVARGSRGITIAELSMRSWVMQPGSIFTRYESVQYASLTFLGALSLSVAVFAMLYTTAASALISPALRFGPYQNTLLYGQIKSSFANPNYLASQCLTPIAPNSWDPDYSAANVSTTCLVIEHASLAFHNYQQYMNLWSGVVGAGNGTDVQANRPLAPGLFYQNTTVNGSWINVIDTKAQSAKFGRVINNVTMAMPHTGVFQAARDPLNNIMQPEDLDGQGLYNIRASLPSPYVNVICANINQNDIAPLVYEKIHNVKLNATMDLPLNYTYQFNWGEFQNLTTPLDDVFGWNADQRPPVFYKYPLMYNTILNNTAPWGRDSIYLLGTGNNAAGLDADSYFLCQIKAGTTPVCSTQYNVQGSPGGQLRSHCEDPNDTQQFLANNRSRVATVSLDWLNVAETAFNALSLNNGVTDGDASNARMLTQFMLSEPALNQNLPSPAEALAVMAGSTLLMSAQDSPFVEFYNYTSPELQPAQIQAFNASVQAQQFASGGTLPYQRAFHIVLVSVFLMNVFVLIYFLVNHGLVTDFSEPPNLFAIAINSPPNAHMYGSCGGGPEGQQYSIKFGVEMENEHLYVTDKSEGVHGAQGRSAWRESVLSFRDLLRRGKRGGGGHAGGQGKWQQLDGDGAVGTELGNVPPTTPGLEEDAPRNEYLGADLLRVDDAGPENNGARSKIAKRFSKLAKRKTGL